jgi:hypothetical protein
MKLGENRLFFILKQREVYDNKIDYEGTKNCLVECSIKHIPQEITDLIYYYELNED